MYTEREREASDFNKCLDPERELAHTVHRHEISVQLIGSKQLIKYYRQKTEEEEEERRKRQGNREKQVIKRETNFLRWWKR